MQVIRALRLMREAQIKRDELDDVYDSAGNDDSKPLDAFLKPIKIKKLG